MAIIHAEVKINGIVQGVGFRPFIHRRAADFGIFGEIRNTSFGVELSVEGEKEKIEGFLSGLSEEKPKLSEIYEIKTEYSGELSGYAEFSISESEANSSRSTLISPDTAICEDCLRELFDKSDRRYRYPFINCTNCGPRFTITKDIPYDRKNTTMAEFPMCETCAEEYGDIKSRRYHAQPDCCPSCGPELSFLDASGKEVSGDALSMARELLKNGGICAVKGLGGVHLACRADMEAAAFRLRERKRRDEKPFALMCRDISVVREIAEVSEAEERLLTSHHRPIILLRKKNKNDFMHISENGYLGVMLPYTPVHYLLMQGEFSCLVMTSANVSELPIVYKDDEAVASLSGIADGFLTNNREIYVRCDDSLAWEYEGREYFARRSRGYVPHPICIEGIYKNILACGAEQKASFSVSRNGEVFPSAHIGDLKNLETLDCYEEQISHFEKIFDAVPELIVCDMHPDYMSGEYARKRAREISVPLVGAYHHHAHMASCMADNALSGNCIGIIWDGTGFGPDGKSLGAEFLFGDYRKAERLGTIEEITLPGGDRAAREISRIGASLMQSADEDPSAIFGAGAEKVKKLLKADINCPKVTSMGRLFDGVASILGIKEKASYEGQAAQLLEAAADEKCEKVYPYTINEKNGLYVFDWREMIRVISRERRSGADISEISAAFMNTLVDMAAEITLQISREKRERRVALSGGSFQNMYILKRLVKRLRDFRLEVYTHRQVSPNDEGISLGQLMIAEKGGGIDVPCSAT